MNNGRTEVGTRILRHWRLIKTVSGFVLTFSLLLFGTSCEDDADIPALATTSVTTWHIPPIRSHLPGPRSVTIAANDDLVVLDNGGRILVYNSTGKVERSWMMPEFDVGRPEGTVVLKDGRIVVCDTHYHRVVIFDSTGNVLQMFGSRGEGPGQFIYPVAVARDDNDLLFIGEYGGNDRIQVFTADGSLLRQFGGFGTAPGEFQRPSGIAWHQGKVFVADAINNRVQEFTDSGAFVRILTGTDAGLQFPYDLAIAPDGSIFVVEYGAGRITQMTQDGTILTRFGSTGRGREQMVTPWGIAVDSKGRLRVADTGNRRLIAIEPAPRR